MCNGELELPQNVITAIMKSPSGREGGQQLILEQGPALRELQLGKKAAVKESERKSEQNTHHLILSMQIHQE